MSRKISSRTVRADFNDAVTVAHYARAAHFLGLWASERILIERFFPDRTAPLLEAGCGAGRVTLGLWEMGFTDITAFDFAEELAEQAKFLAQERTAWGVRIHVADATKLMEHEPITAHAPQGFAGAIFAFNGLMQIPGRANRRLALSGLASACRRGAPLLFTTHDRDVSPTEKALWRLEAVRWEKGLQDARLVEFGDRYFEDETGRTFMHLPDRNEILEDLAASGWTHEFDALRREVARESKAVREFSDECRFWAARKGMKKEE